MKRWIHHCAQRVSRRSHSTARVSSRRRGWRTSLIDFLYCPLAHALMDSLLLKSRREGWVSRLRLPRSRLGRSLPLFCFIFRVLAQHVLKEDRWGWVWERREVTLSKLNPSRRNREIDREILLKKQKWWQHAGVEKSIAQCAWVVGGVQRKSRREKEVPAWKDKHFSGFRIRNVPRKWHRGSTAVTLTSRRTEVATSVREPKQQGLLGGRRTGEVVPWTESFGDLTTADHKVLSEGGESRNNHWFAIVVQDLATQWIQSYPCKTKLLRRPERSSRKFFDPPVRCWLRSFYAHAEQERFEVSRNGYVEAIQDPHHGGDWKWGSPNNRGSTSICSRVWFIRDGEITGGNASSSIAW